MVITQGQATDLAALATIAKALSAEGIGEQIVELHEKWVDLNALNAEVSIARAKLDEREKAIADAEVLAASNNARADEALNRANGLVAQAKSDAAEAGKLRAEAEKVLADAQAKSAQIMNQAVEVEQQLLLRQTKLDAEFKRADALRAEYEAKLSQLKSIAG